MNESNFYHEFEANFRGSREEILGRLRAYSSFLIAVADQFPDAKAVDLGCGRGEWLELVQSFDIAAHGVDLDDGMLADCFARGLSAEKADAIEHLKSLPDESLAIVSGFHIAEHLPFDVLRTLVREAHRCLRPGGLLILETPNAENISVGTLSFHMDPTHVRPLPPGLLSFLPRYYGFKRVDVLRLQENAALRESENARLYDVLTAASPDYSIVAQKDAEPAVLSRFDAAFGVTDGLTLETLANRYEQGIDRQLAEAVNAAHETNARLDAARRHLEELENQLEQLHATIFDYQDHISAIYTSTSWRLTWIVRFIGMIVGKGKRFINRILRRIRNKLLSITRRLVVTTLSAKASRRVAKSAMHRMPGLARRLKSVLFEPEDGRPATDGFHQALSARHLSPRAKLILEELEERLKDPA